MHPKAPVTLPSAISTLERLGYVVGLDNDFVVRGVEHRLSVIDDQVFVKGDRGVMPWLNFSRTLRPQ
jgi:hypothetical protein